MKQVELGVQGEFVLCDEGLKTNGARGREYRAAVQLHVVPEEGGGGDLAFTNSATAAADHLAMREFVLG